MVFLSNSPSLRWWSPLFRVLRKLLMCGLCGQTWRPGDISPKSPTRATQMSDPLAARRMAWERLVGRCPWNKRHVCLFVCLFVCFLCFSMAAWVLAPQVVVIQHHRFKRLDRSFRYTHTPHARDMRHIESTPLHEESCFWMPWDSQIPQGSRNWMLKGRGVGKAWEQIGNT